MTMRKIKQTERPFLIRYTNGDRHLFDSAATLANAKERAFAYIEKRRNGRAEVFKRGALVLKLTIEFSEGMPAGADTGRAVEVGPPKKAAEAGGAIMSIGERMIAERQREIAVSLKALRMMQEHHGNRLISLRDVGTAESAEWYAKAERLIPPVPQDDNGEGTS